ncbi:MAG: hypothetical protein RL341_801 [Pseudomonadota bacterium]|jgi:hypothetical protein
MKPHQGNAVPAGGASQSRVATAQQDEVHGTGSAGPAQLHTIIPATRELFVLSGLQAGVSTALPEGRFVVGNTQEDSDIVLELGVAGRTLCLLRVERSQIVAMSLAGDVWLGEKYIEPQHAHELPSGQVLTLGRVSVAVLPAGSDAWRDLAVPTQLERPAAAGGPATVALASAAAAKAARKWRNATIYCLGLMCAALLAAGFYVITHEPQTAATTLQQSRDKLAVQLAEAGFQYVGVTVDRATARLSIQGYVKDAAALEKLKSIAAAQTATPLLQVRVDDVVVQAVQRQFDSSALKLDIKYAGKGWFAIETTGDQRPALEQVAAKLMQEVQGVEGFEIRYLDLLSEADRLPVMQKLTRQTDGRGQGAAQAYSRAQPSVRVLEIVLEDVPSIIASDGKRYFEGALLPDGSEVKAIQQDRVLLLKNGIERADVLHPSATPQPIGPPQGLDAAPSSGALREVGRQP